ncbi:MAG: hypothetical protein KKH98_03355 [Spirochaetes bacterium]|nr:hypothetical protein [Spirochaetota bacterium]
MKSYLEEARNKFHRIISDKDLLKKEITIESRVLTPEEAIGNPERDDFPILRGKERIMEASFQGSFGHAFTNRPGNYNDTLENIIKKELKNNFHRAVLIAAMNAVMRYLKMIQGTRHCRDEEPEECAEKLISWIKEEYPEREKITLIGFQPSFIEKLSGVFILKVLDLNEDNFGKKYGVDVLDGEKHYKEAINWSDLTLVTGSVFVNDTIGKIALVRPVNELVFYGVTVAAIAELLNLKRICFCSG